MAKTASNDPVALYIASLPPAARKVFKQVRTLIRRAAPGATERISYQILRFDWQGRLLIYVAGWREHIGLYPITAGLAKEFGKELQPYRSGKATLKFPLDEPLPADLIRRIIRFQTNAAQATAAAGGKSSRGSRTSRKRN
jgi:uncharacterized protein YdhG (YjbR/CyaY superfamily)